MTETQTDRIATSLEEANGQIKVLREKLARQEAESDRLRSALERQLRTNSDYVPYPETTYDR